ncbi:hypothetical protein D3C71_1457220 [compost metagenome]
MQGGIGVRAVPDRHIHTGVLQQVHGIRAGIQAQLVLRIGIVEASQPGHQPQRREGMRGGDRQRARGRRGPQGVQGLGDIQQRAVHADEQARAGIGQPHAARHAIEQREPRLPFQRLDLMRHRSGRHRQLGRGRLEAAQPGRGLEGAQRRDRKRSKHGASP